jgi:hypothetical protein
MIKILNPFVFARFFYNPTNLNPLMQNVSLQSFIGEDEISVSNIVMVAAWFGSSSEQCKCSNQSADAAAAADYDAAACSLSCLPRCLLSPPDNRMAATPLELPRVFPDQEWHIGLRHLVEVR